MKTKFIKSKIILSIAAISLLTACGSAEAKDANALESDSTAVFNPLVVAKPIQTKNFSHSIEVLGFVSSDKNIVLSAEYSGKITSIKVKEGQSIKRGQTIAIIDGQSLNDNSTELKTQLDYAQYMLDKQNKLSQSGVGSEFAVKQAENQVNSLKDKLKSVSTQKGKTVIRAPFSGVVEQIMAREGEFVGPGSQISRIVNVDDITISAEVSEQLLGNIKAGKEGTTLSMKFDHLAEPVISTIHSIGKFIDPVNRTVKVRCEMTNNTVLLPNMTGKISISDVEIKDATIIPSTSILKDELNKDFIYILGEQMGGDSYGLEKVYVETISSFKGKSAISAEVSLKNKMVVDDGAKGVSEQDVVKLKVITNE